MVVVVVVAADAVMVGGHDSATRSQKDMYHPSLTATASPSHIGACECENNRPAPTMLCASITSKSPQSW